MRINETDKIMDVVERDDVVFDTICKMMGALIADDTVETREKMK